jgi:hypothetical protein
MIYLVDYDLVAIGANYEALYNVLRAPTGWHQLLESSWLLYSTDSIEVWSERIRRVISPKDKFMIVDITNAVTTESFGGWLPQPTWEWLNKAKTAIRGH